MTPAKEPRVLVVEDDSDSFGWLRRRLPQYGYKVEWAGTVSEALAKLDAGLCAVILDLAMPDGGGSAILRAIRDRQLPIKVAVVAGIVGDVLDAETAHLKPDVFFGKPPDVIDLMTWLKSACP